jgi:hypothetical protein
VIMTLPSLEQHAGPGAREADVIMAFWLLQVRYSREHGQPGYAR